MPEYQVIARKYRPQQFEEVVGQEAIVATLRNAIRQKRLAHAYLFCGSRGTGKTTLARLFAKALNCPNRNGEGEPCNQCTSCKEITLGNSLDVLEIDGASHRGIDDVRQINETVGYASAGGGYKIYIIDEVHMLTKEAFNALLKTLEEPPARVLFFFATTEPHKMPSTILSRCQRFNLSRIPFDNIVGKLRDISGDLKASIDEESLRLIAHRSEGGLRDAESLLDQILSFKEGSITQDDVASILGIVPRDALFDLDKAAKAGNLAMAFDMSHRLFSEGKDLIHFVETLTEHFRTILMVLISGKDAPFLNLTAKDRERYEASAKLYTQEQCMTLLDFLLEAQDKIRFHPSARIALETILLRILRIHQRLPVEYLVRRLTEIEQRLQGAPASPKAAPAATPAPTPAPARASVSEDPTPSPADLGIPPPAAKIPVGAPPPMQTRHDTLLQFAAIELEGTVKKPRY